MIHSFTAFILATLSRALILLAFSEFIFFNEGPIIDFTGKGGPLDVTLALLEFAAFYCLPGALLVALEPYMTTWPRVILCGAFVGWSIEGAMVPVVYENVPFSYFWTSVGWHAIVDVAIGCVWVRQLLTGGSWRRCAAAMLGLGVFTAVWSTWAWSELDLTGAKFASVLAIITGLLLVGYALAALGRPHRHNPGAGFWIAVCVNLVCCALYAVAVPLLAAGLAVLALLNGAILWRAPKGQGHPLDLPSLRPARLGLVLLLPLAAQAGYYVIVQSGQGAALGEAIVWLFAALGLLVYLAAMGAALWPRRSRHKKSRP